MDHLYYNMKQTPAIRISKPQDQKSNRQERSVIMQQLRKWLMPEEYTITHTCVLNSSSASFYKGK